MKDIKRIYIIILTLLFSLLISSCSENISLQSERTYNQDEAVDFFSENKKMVLAQFMLDDCIKTQEFISNGIKTCFYQLSYTYDVYDDNLCSESNLAIYVSYYSADGYIKTATMTSNSPGVVGSYRFKISESEHSFPDSALVSVKTNENSSVLAKINIPLNGNVVEKNTIETQQPAKVEKNYTSATSESELEPVLLCIDIIALIAISAIKLFFIIKRKRATRLSDAEKVEPLFHETSGKKTTNIVPIILTLLGIDALVLFLAFGSSSKYFYLSELLFFLWLLILCVEKSIYSKSKKVIPKTSFYLFKFILILCLPLSFIYMISERLSKLYLIIMFILDCAFVVTQTQKRLKHRCIIVSPYISHAIRLLIYASLFLLR